MLKWAVFSRPPEFRQRNVVSLSTIINPISVGPSDQQLRLRGGDIITWTIIDNFCGILPSQIQFFAYLLQVYLGKDKRVSAFHFKPKVVIQRIPRDPGYSPPSHPDRVKILLFLCIVEIVRK